MLASSPRCALNNLCFDRRGETALSLFNAYVRGVYCDSGYTGVFRLFFFLVPCFFVGCARPRSSRKHSRCRGKGGAVVCFVATVIARRLAFGGMGDAPPPSARRTAVLQHSSTYSTAVLHHIRYVNTYSAAVGQATGGGNNSIRSPLGLGWRGGWTGITSGAM